MLIYLFKNNFKKIKKYIILIYFRVKNILNHNHYHIFKHIIIHLTCDFPFLVENKRQHLH
jgi:hypothetical protein